MAVLWQTVEGRLALAGWVAVTVAVLVGGTVSGVALVLAAPLLVGAALVGRRSRVGAERTAWVVGLVALAVVALAVGLLELL